MAIPDSSRQAAVPAYLGGDFREAAPGHRFNLYLRVWNDQWSKVKEVPSQDEVAIGDDDHRRAQALAERQRRLAERAEAIDPDTVVSLPATAAAAFTTGLGMEHPLENGFAFLTPHGLPYLPGSSVKGVLRQAARELDAGGAFEDPDREWDREDIERLFGSAGSDSDDLLERRRGALVFHDVFPVLPQGANLQWDIMTPHQGHYYQDATGATPPHDNAGPTPIYFLTVPAGSAVRLVIGCDRALLAASDLLKRDGDGIPRWQRVVRALVAHAFAWLGFGAKTAIGYGAFDWDTRRLRAEDERREAQRAAQRKQEELAALPPGERRAAELLESKSNPTYPDHRHLLEQLEAGHVGPDEQAAVAHAALERLEQWRAGVSGPKKKRQQRLQELADHEARLRRFTADE